MIFQVKENGTWKDADSKVIPHVANEEGITVEWSKDKTTFYKWENVRQKPGTSSTSEDALGVHDQRD